jgi:hypothetical protein
VIRADRQQWLVAALCLSAFGPLLLVGSQASAQAPANEEPPPEHGEQPPEQEAEDAEPAEGIVVEDPMKKGRLRVGIPEPAEKTGSPVTHGYPTKDRGVGMPANVETDLDTSFPEPGTVLPKIPPPRPYFEFKEGLYERIGLKLAFSYQMLALGASSAKPAGEDLSQGKQTAWAGALLIEAQWVLYQRGKDYPGGFVLTFDWRQTFQNTAQPSFFLLDTGSAWAHDFYYLTWRPWFPVLFYEQGFKKDLFVLRVGQLSPLQFIDFFRFKDPRTSFTGSPFTTPSFINPFAPPGFGIQFDLRPIKDNELYFTGIIHDQNAQVEVYSWNEFFTLRDLYYGLEIGYFWKRSPGDFDHIHVDVIYASAPAQPSPVGAFVGVGSEPGWIFKAHGSKQIDRWVVYGNYTYNTAQGGPFGATVVDHSVAAGVSFLRPFHINGEWSLGAVWAKPINPSLRDQYGIETYWKILLFEDLWVTPDLQVIFKPTYNTTKNVLAVGGIKLRLFF